MSGLPPQEPCAQNDFVRFSRGMWIILGLGLTVSCGVVDWFSGPEIAFSVIYLIPISLVAYKCDRWLGLAQAMICALTWLFVELTTNTSYSSAIIPYWNGVVRFLIFATVALLVAEVAERRRGEKALRRAHEQSEERAQKLAVSEASLARERVLLQSILFSMGEGVVVVDATGKISLSNPAADQILRAAGDTTAGGQHPLQEMLNTSRVQSREISLPRGDATEALCLLVSGRPPGWRE
jgi:PAS domain-containing protein